MMTVVGQTTIVKLNIKTTDMYDDSAYCCPSCGKPSSECEPTDHYSYVCPDCGTDFETPDT